LQSVAMTADMVNMVAVKWGVFVSHYARKLIETENMCKLHT